jgi:hypothetical protein
MNTQQAAEQVALSKINTHAGAREMLKAGEYDIDTTVRISGKIRVGEDYKVAPTVSIPLKETLALFIAYSGVTGEHAIKALRLAMQHSISLTGCGQGELAKNMPIVDENIARVQNEIIATLPRQPRKGQVTTKLNVEKVETLQVA